MTDTGGALGGLDGVFARVTLTSDHVAIVPDDGSGGVILPLNDIVHVVLEMPSESDDYREPGYIQFVTEDTDIVDGPIDYLRGLPNVVELDSAQIGKAKAFARRVTRMLPQRDASLKSDSKPFSPQPKSRPSSTHRSSRSSVPTLEELGTVVANRMRTLTAWIALLASATVFGVWYLVWVAIFSAASTETGSSYSGSYSVTNVQPGYLVLALFLAGLSTAISYVVARVLVK